MHFYLFQCKYRKSLMREVQFKTLTSFYLYRVQCPTQMIKEHQMYQNSFWQWRATTSSCLCQTSSDMQEFFWHCCLSGTCQQIASLQDSVTRYVSSWNPLSKILTASWKEVLLSKLSGLLDAVDGHAARMLNQSSKFGAMLDMLTDRCATM